MRDWINHEEALKAAGGQLIVVTTDPPHRLRDAVARHALVAPFAVVDPSFWDAWGLANPKNPDLPHPATIVLRDGHVVWSEIHVNFRERTPPPRVLASLDTEAPRSARVPVPAAEGPDWAHAVSVQAQGHPAGATLTIAVREGFHVYGAKEESAIPLSVTGGQATLPDGTLKKLGKNMGSAWVLDGTFTVDVRGEPPLSGDTTLQVCTMSACSPPRTLPWSTATPSTP